MTYDLITNMLSAASIKLEKIVISELKNGVYYAVIVLNNDGKKLEIDSRPSDALNLALRNNAPIYVSRSVFEEAKERKEVVDSSH